MTSEQSSLPELRLLEPRIIADSRGYFFEAYNERTFEAATGFRPRFVQENQSRSRRHVLRGLHYQISHAQGKLIRIVAGEAFHVAVDLRRSSATFGQSASFRLSAENRRSLWMPPGFAHGFLALGEATEVVYMVTDFHAPEHERCLLWNDPVLGIAWPLNGEPLLSDRDRRGLPLSEAETYP
jgi:dTDP-4-dehydrorhamnose 3,5-epimerase